MLAEAAIAEMPFEAISNEIIEQYQADDRPWIVGFSGGKDSTTLLQMVFYALQTLPKKRLKKEVHVLCNDTLVENPAVVRYIDDTLNKIRAAGERYKFPMSVVKVTPTLADSFWVNLIGKSLPTSTMTESSIWSLHSSPALLVDASRCSWETAREV